MIEMKKQCGLFPLTLALAILAGAIGAHAQQVTLRENIRVSGDIVRIGDLFENTGDAAGIAIYRAPAPGKTGVVNAGRLVYAARRQGVRWTNPYQVREITITRPGQLIAQSEITDAIVERIRRISDAYSSGDGFNVILEGDPEPFFVAANGSLARIEVLHLNFDPRSGRFAATLSARAGNAKPRRRSYQGRIVEVVEIPVLVRRIDRGDIIAASDVVMRTYEKRRVNRRAIIDRADIVGLSARRPLRALMPLTSSDVERPRIVQRNSLITISYDRPGLTVSGQGRALSDGSMGDVISVLNLRSNRRIQGTVTAKNMVAVTVSSARRTKISAVRN